jgi:arginyl-tRNA synthetase
MQTIVLQLEQAFRSAIATALGMDADPLIGPSQNERFGDYQSNAAMGLAKQVAEKTGQKANPRQIAEKIKARLALGEMVSDVSIAGPGFINVRLAPAWLATQLQQIGRDPQAAVQTAQQPQTVVIDYSGPNIAKEMHVGHLRSTIIGDALARVIQRQGHTILPQNHIGDWGTQFGMLIGELLGGSDEGEGQRLQIEDLEKFYRSAKAHFDSDAAFQQIARRFVVRLQAHEPLVMAAWSAIVQETRKHYEPLYGRLGVLLERGHEFGESRYNALLPDIVRELREKGIAVQSEGAVVVPTEGFEAPLIIQKTDGGYLYGTTDLAAIRYRITELRADRIIYTHDSRQAQHFAQVFAAARKASWTREGEVRLEYAPFGTMLGEDGKPFKTRSGEVVKLKDLLDEAEQRAFDLVTQKNAELPEQQRRDIARAVGIGAVKYFDLARDRVSDYIFSWDKMLAMEGNTAPYLQYAYARIRSIFRKAGERGVTISAPTILLDTPEELALAKHILRLGEIVALVARELKPHHLCNYLYELATRFSGFFENCPVLQSEDPIRSSRLMLCEVTGKTLAEGLNLLGIEHPEQM